MRFSFKFSISVSFCLSQITWYQYLKEFPNIKIENDSRSIFEDNLAFMTNTNIKYGSNLGISPYLHISKENFNDMFKNSIELKPNFSYRIEEFSDWSAKYSIDSNFEDESLVWSLKLLTDYYYQIFGDPIFTTSGCHPNDFSLWITKQDIKNDKCVFKDLKLSEDIDIYFAPILVGMNVDFESIRNIQFYDKYQVLNLKSDGDYPNFFGLIIGRESDYWIIETKFSTIKVDVSSTSLKYHCQIF